MRRAWRRTAVVAASVGMLLTSTACSGDEGSTNGDAGADEDAAYIEALDATCAETTARLDALPTPPDEISLALFTDEAASALNAEAERMRLITAPADHEPDHRALIANTDDQARAWIALGATDPADGPALEAASAQIAQLSLGRNDLAVEIGAEACVREAS